MVTSSGTMRGAEGGTNEGWGHRGRFVPGLTFEASCKKEHLKELEGAQEEAGVVGTQV